MRKSLFFALTAAIGFNLSGAPQISRAQEKENLAQPEDYDIFYGKKDRIYLTGAWKFKFVWNFLSPEWIKDNMEVGKTGKGKGLVEKKGTVIPYKEIKFDKTLCVDSPDASWRDMLVPSAWNYLMPGEKPKTRKGIVWQKKYYAMGGIGYYRKNIFIPAGKKGQRLVIFFENVETECVVWVNGREVARHKNWDEQGSGRVAGAFLDYFEAEITDVVEWGKENIITVGVYDSGLPFAWFAPDTGGITGLAWIDCYPQSYFSKVLVNAPYKAGKVFIDALPAPKSKLPEKYIVEISPWKSGFYEFPGKDKKAFKLEVLPQKSELPGFLRLEVPVDGIAAWDINNPNLYELKISDPRNGKVMALERFGVRTITTSGKNFLLNGKPVYFFGNNTGSSILGGGFSHGPGTTNKYGYNYKNTAREFIKAKKASGFSSQRIHTGPNHRNAYYFCDEVGLMVREEFTPARIVNAISKEMTSKTPDFEGSYVLSQYFSKDGKSFSDSFRNKMREFLDYTFNSPCVVTWSGGNEMAAGDPEARKYCELFYDYLHKNDPQKRPITSSSGMHWGVGKDKRIAWKPLPSDYLDFHNYAIAPMPLMSAAIKTINDEYDELINKVYGGKIYPTILGEFFNQNCTEKRLSPFSPEIFDSRGNPDIEKYAKLINGELLKMKGRFRHQRTARETGVCVSIYGVRTLKGREEAGILRGLNIKRCLESIRRNCLKLSGYSIHSINDPWFYMNKTEDGFGAPEMKYLKTVQQPLIAIPDFWIKNLLAGQDFSFDLMAINWGSKDFSGVLNVKIIDKKGFIAATAKKEISGLQISKHKDLRFDLKIAEDAPTGTYKMLSEFISNGKILSRNFHRISILRPGIFKAIQTNKKIALFETSENKEATKSMLENFGIKTTALENFNGLSPYDVIIIGKNSCNQTVFESARKIRNYLKDGGRLIVFSQKTANPVPWAPSLKFQPSGPSPFADPIDMASPILKGLTPEDFICWGQNQIVHKNLIAPITDNVIVAGAATGCSLQMMPQFGMLLTQYRIGKGACMMSQLELIDNYKEDSMAKLAAWNMLHYALATPWEASEAKPLPNDKDEVFEVKLPTGKKICYIMMNKNSNRNSLNAPAGSWYCKNSEFDELPAGVRLYKNMLFRIFRWGHSLILGTSPNKPDNRFPPSKEIKGHSMRYKDIYLLHSAAWVKAKEGDEIGRIEFIYTDGTSHFEALKNGVDIADWHKPKPHKNASIVFKTRSSKGFYLTKIANPNPRKKVKTLKFYADKNNGFWMIFAITALRP